MTGVANSNSAVFEAFGSEFVDNTAQIGGITQAQTPPRRHPCCRRPLDDIDERRLGQHSVSLAHGIEGLR